MAAAFNLTAQLNLQGPTNVGAIVSSIKKQLNNISANVNVKVSPGTSQNIAALNAAFASFNATLATTATNSNNAANAIRGLTQAIGQANNPLNNLQQNMANNATAAAQLTQNLQNLNRTQRVCANDMEELGRQAAGTIRRFAAFGVVTGGIYKLGNAINSASKEFLEFNRELVRVAQVTDTSLSNLTSLTKQISSLSTTFGVASSDLIKVSSTLAQAGLSAKDTEKALKALALSALAPSFDSLNDTVEGSIALMRQFGIGADQLEGALGSVNAVAAKFAVEASDIITAIQRTGGVFATASKGVATGTEALNQFISVFTSIRATTRESAETISTGLRTIFTRIQRGQTIDALKEYGVVLTDLEGKFVGPYEATRRLSEGLSKLDPRDLRFGQIVEELGGFRQIGKVIPLIQQFAVAQQALKVAQKGQSSLAYDAAIAQESVANKMTKVREEFVALIRSIGESKSFQTFVKLSLDLTSQLIRLADAAKNVLPAMLAIAAIRGGPAALSFGRGFIGGLRRNQGGPIGFASGGFVPGQGNSDTVPAMLTPGEFVIRKKAVQAIGADRLAGMNRYARGGKVKPIDPALYSQSISGMRGNETSILNQGSVGVAILKSPKKGLTDSSINKQAIIKTVGKQYSELLGSSLQGSIKIDREGLPLDTYELFSEGIDEGLIQAVNTATSKVISKYPELPYPAINDANKAKYLKGVNDAARGNLFEEILTSMRNKGAYEDNPDPQRPFDFSPTNQNDSFGLNNIFPKLSTLKYVDAKASNPKDDAIGKKIANQTLREIGVTSKRKKGIQTQPTSALSIEELKKKLGWKSGVVLGGQVRMAGLKTNDLVTAGLLSPTGVKGKYNLVERNLGGPIQKFAKGGMAKNSQSDLLSSMLKSYPLSFSPTSTVSRILKAEGSENSLKAIQSAYNVQSAKIIGSGAESVIFDIGKKILKISQGGNYNLPKGVSGIAGYSKVKKFGQLTAALQEKLNTDQIGTSKDISLLQRKLGKKGLNWSDAHELNIGYDKKGRPKVLDGSIMPKYAKGGSAEDTVPALLTPGEFVINKKAASRIGLSTLHKMNHADKVQGFNKGGSVQRFVKGGTALAEVQKTDTKTAAALTAALSGKGYTTSRLGPIQNRQLDAVQVQEDFLNFTRKLDSLDLPLNDAIAAIKAWTRATAQGADATQAFDRAMSSSTMSAAHSITNPPITPGGGGRGGGARAGILGRLKGGIGGITNMSSGAGMLLTMAGGTAIEGMSQAYGGEKTATGRNISAIGGSVLNYGAVGASIGGPWGAAAGAAVGLAAGLVQAEEASKQFAVDTAKAASDIATEVSTKKVEAYSEKSTASNRASAIKSLETSFQEEETLAKAISEKNRVGLGGRMANFLTGGAVGLTSLTNYKEDLFTSAGEISKSQSSGSENTQKLLLADMMKAGKTFDQLAAGMKPDELFKYTNQIAQADQAYVYNQLRRARQIEDLEKAGKTNEAEALRKSGIEEDKTLALAAARLATADETAAVQATETAKQMKNLGLAIQNSIMSLERTFDIMEQTGNRFSFELDSVAENAKSMMSGKGQKAVGLSGTMNILKNPLAYSAAERQGAMQRGVSGLDQKTGQNLIRLANFAPRARDTALKISAGAGFDPESQREAGEEIKTQLRDQITQAFGQTNISTSMIDTLNKAIDEELKDAKGGAIDWNGLIEKALGPSFKGAEGANKIIEQQLKIQADLYGQISDISEQYVDNMEKVTERTNALTDMQEKARMSLRSAMGEKLTSKDKIANRARSAADKAGMDSRTYGNVGLMALQIENTMAQRDAKIREKSALENSGASPQALAKVNVELATLQSSLKKASKGLEDLPQELQSNIDDMIGEIQDRVGKMEAQKEAGSRFAEKLVGNTPEEMMGLNRTFALLQNTLNGNIITINKSFVAQQAFAEALRSGKNATEAMRDAQRAFADENKNALGLFSELMGVAGVEGPQFDMMKADLMENFAKAQGMGLEKNPMFQMILDQLRRDPAERAKEDPVVMALVEKIKLAQKMQTDAINTINNNAINAQQTAFSAAIGEFTDKINKAQLNLMVNVQGAAWAGGQNPVQVGVAARAKGGIIYASKGQYVNFEPKGTDTVPAMLTPGEFVVNRKATQDNLPLLKSINSGYYAKGGYLNETGLTASATQGLMEHYVSQSQVLKNPRDRKRFVFQAQRDLRSLKPYQKIAYEVVRQFGLQFNGANKDLNALSSSPISGINKFNTIAGGFNQDGFGILEPVIVNPLEKADDLVKKIKESPVEYLQAKTLSNKANKRWSYLGEILANLNTGKKIIEKSPDFENSVFLKDIYGFMGSVEANASKEQKIIREVYDNVGARTGYWFPEQNFRGFSPSNFPKADYFAGGGRARGSDTVPAMLTPGEFVVNKNSTQKNLGLLKQINKGYSNGGAVRYYQNGGMAGGSSGSSSYGVIDVLGGRLDNFIQQLSQAIPSTVRLEVPQPIPVNVVINGAGILQNVLGGPLGELIATQIREAFARQSRATEGAVGE